MSHILKPGNVTVITGAASGIGLATAKLFASKGMRIVMSDTSADLDAASALHRQILWSATDITENRTPLSPWHTDWKEEFR